MTRKEELLEALERCNESKHRCEYCDEKRCFLRMFGYKREQLTSIPLEHRRTAYWSSKLTLEFLDEPVKEAETKVERPHKRKSIVGIRRIDNDS